MMPTGSKVGLAVICPASAVLPRIASSSDATALGTAKHLALQSSVEGVEHALPIGIDPDDATVDEAIAGRLRVPGILAEQAFALDVVTGFARPLATRDRSYEVTPSEIAATLDYVVPPVNGLACVYDLKTGRTDPDDAASNWQLRVGAIMVAAHYDCDAVEVGLIYAPEGRSPQWRLARFERFELDAFWETLSLLMSHIVGVKYDIEQGRMPALHSGPHCGWCPAKISCPAHLGIIRASVATGAADLTSVSARVAAMTSQELTDAWKAAQPLIEAAKALKAAFAEAAKVQPFATGPGMQYGMREVRRTVYDGSAVWESAKHLYGDDAARDFVGIDASKASVVRGLKARKAYGDLRAKSVAAAERIFAAELAGRDGITKIKTMRLEEHRVDETVVSDD